MTFHPSGGILLRIAFAAALLIPGFSALGESATQDNSGPASDPLKRLEWLKSRTPPPPVRKTYFRTSESRAATIRTPESQPRATRPAEGRPPAPQPPATPAATPAPVEVKPPAATTPAPKSAAIRATPAPSAKVRAAVAPAPTPQPPIAAGPEAIASRSRPEATPVLVARLATPPPVEFRSIARSTPAPRTSGDSRYPWKTGIVTTVFWVGEPVGGNNFTHNFSSSWDPNWARNFGGFDNPKPEARRRFIPVKFVPRQNPFYIALPYNDVTRGTTKPEARQVIPWFKEAFQREGLSVCRDRWVAVRNRAGKIGYGQWSDCGPFRTDHWQYVFGKERPKPNLNKGAGLDVSPALRDYLGLDGTDLTDWKFVDFKDIPSGPWSLYGENNTFTQKSLRSAKRAGKANEILARIP